MNKRRRAVRDGNIVLRAGHQFGNNFYVGFSGGWFSLEYKDIDGELLSARASLERRPVRHFGAMPVQTVSRLFELCVAATVTWDLGTPCEY